MATRNSTRYYLIVSFQEHFPIDEGDLRETHDQNYVRCVAELRNKSKKALDELANKFDSVYLCQVFLYSFSYCQTRTHNDE